MATVAELVAKLTLDSSDFDEKLKDKENQSSSFGEKLGGGLKTAAKVGFTALAGATTATVAFGKSAVDAGMQFDAAMSQVAATSGKSVEEISDLRNFALEMGSTTAFSATQAAEALNYMALAGYDSATSMKMLPNVLNLAAAGGMNLGRASDMVTDAQTALGLSLDETSVMVDQMAKTASTTNTSVEQLGDAFLTIGGNARQMSGGTKELSAVLGVLADNGIKGSEAGTHLRNILLKMNPTTDAAVAAFEKLGLETYDSQGNLRDMSEIFLDLGKSMEGMTNQERTQLLSDMFNTTDLASVNALLSTSADRWAEVGAAIDQAAGSSGEMANTQLDNLSGSLTLFRSALEGLQIAISDKITPVLTTFVQQATEGISNITKPIMEGNFDEAINVISGFLEGALTTIVEMLPSVIDVGMQILNSLISGLIANLPQIVVIGIDLITQLASGLISAIPQLVAQVPAIISAVISAFSGRSSDFLNTGISFISNMITGFFNALPNMIASAGSIISSLLAKWYSVYPQVLQVGVNIIGKIANGFLNNLPAIISAIISVLAQLIATITSHMPQILQKGIEIIGQLAAGLIQAIPKVVAAIPQIISSIVSGFTSHDWGSIGSNIISGIGNGIRSGIGAIADAARSAASSALNAAKRLLGIASPSKVMRDQVGKMIPAGIASGIDSSIGDVEDAMTGIRKITEEPVAVTTAVSAEGTQGGTYGEITAAINELSDSLVGKMVTALERMQFDIDGREFARLVRAV